MRTVFDELVAYGFDEKQIHRMIAVQPAYLTQTWESIKKRFDGFEEYGCTREEVVRMFAIHPSIITSTWERMREKLQHMEELGVSKKTLLKALKKNMAFLRSSEERLHGTEQDPGILVGLAQYGFSAQDMDSMIARYPNFLSRAWNMIHPTFQALESYGFTPAQIITMCTRYPNIINFSWERTHGTDEQPGILLSMEANGFTKKQIIEWCERVPALLTYSWDRIKHQLELAVAKPIPITKELFVFSPKKTEWRFAYLTEKGFSTGKSNLYRGHKEFVERFGQDYEPPAPETSES